MSHAAPHSVPQAAVDAWGCPSCGATLQTACATLLGHVCRIDTELVTHRLEQAGATLLAMRCRSPFPVAYASNWPDTLLDAAEAYGWTQEEVRPAVPSSADISRMDTTLAWLGLIERPVLRRIVAARLLVNPITGHHICRWKKLSVIIHTDVRTLHRWHSAGIACIVAAL